MYASDVQTRSA